MLSEEQLFRMIQKLEESRTNNLREVIAALLPARQDRDMLITIKANQESQMSLLTSMRNEDLKKIAESDIKAAAAHRRIDGMSRWINGSVIVTVGGMILTALFVYIRVGSGS